MKYTIYSLIFISSFLISCNKIEDSVIEVKTKGMKLISSTEIEIDGWVYPIQSSNNTYIKWGICYGTESNPTLENDISIESNDNSTSYSVVLTELIPTQEYYARAYFENKLEDKITYGLDCNFTMPSAQIGEVKEGGIVFWVDPNDSNHGLVCSISQFNSTQWSWENEVIDGADGFDIGDGYQNTLDIVTGSIYSNSAADFCANSEEGGYTDWFLPSADELFVIASYRNLINNTMQDNGWGIVLNQSSYWSSTEYDSINAVVVDFGTDSKFNQNKYSHQNVRAIRAF